MEKKAPVKKINYTAIISSIIGVVLIIAYCLFALVFHKAKASGVTVQIDAPKTTINKIVWPDYGESAVGLEGYGVLAVNGEDKSVPIASIAKTMLALSVMEKKPFDLGDQGATVTIGQDDADYYYQYLKQNGSLVPVNVGEEISEYQLLQALLLPSGDNIADTLAEWAFGSIDNYLEYANDMASEWGLTKTHLADAGGLSAETVSSARDLIIIGEKLMADPVLAEIVAQESATLPVAGTVYNYNSLLGENGVIGIKTGNTDEAGGCLLFAATTTVDGKDQKIIGAILGAETRSQVLSDTRNFLQTNKNIFQSASIVTENQVVGSYDVKWDKKVEVLASKEIAVMLTKSDQVSVSVDLKPITGAMNKGDEVGTVTVTAGANTYTSPAVLADSIKKPSNWWRLVHL